MPFTFSHPALVLPLTRWLSATGLIIGSLTPDFEYFLRMKIKSNFSHTLDGLFWFDLPIGILLCFIFHNLVRNQLFSNLPLFLSKRLMFFTSFRWNDYFKENWFKVLISVLIGAFSHILWDGFTHEGGFFIERIPVLKERISINNYTIPFLKILQHTSSFAGVLVIIFAIWRLPEKKVTVYPINLNYWIFFLLLLIIIFGIRVYFGLRLYQYGNVIVSLISASLTSLIVTSLFSLNKIKR